MMKKESSLKEKISDYLNYKHIYIRYRRQGYSKYICNKFINLLKEDALNHNDFPGNLRRQFHLWGYCIDTAKNYGITEKNRKRYVSDLQKMWFQPINNSFSKWFRERLSPYIVMHPFRKDFPKLYAEVLLRNNQKYVIPKYDLEEHIKLNSLSDIIVLLKEKKELYIGYVELITRKYRGNRKVAFVLKYEEETQSFFLDGNLVTEEEIIQTLEEFPYSFLVQENYKVAKRIGTRQIEERRFGVYIDYVSVFLGNRNFDDADIVEAYVKVFIGKRKKAQLVPVKVLNRGVFYYDGKKYVVPKWDVIKEKAIALAKYASEVELLKLNIRYKEDRVIIGSISSTPQISKDFAMHKKLNQFMKKMIADRKVSIEEHKANGGNKRQRQFRKWSKIQRFLVKHGLLRRGIRTYMFMLWKDSIKDDFLHTKDYSLSKKIWAWRRGFLSFRIHQYGLTEENYKDFLSDLDYHWLNRINNYTQKWVNDKTTFRYIMEPFKQYCPEYYFLIQRRGNKVCAKALPDAPEGTKCSIDAIVDLLKIKKEFAFKPSSGTHGDGFYKLVFEDGNFFINDKLSTEQELIEVLTTQKSYYIVTDYLYLADELAKIYPRSLNTIRMMVINQDVYNPKIMHAYMRIGAGESGFTDNIAYGGIAVKIDLETGRYYGGETIVNHRFYDCDVHPNTGVSVNGYVPHWDEIKEGVIRFCKEFPELEYLGFDIAATEDSFKILEVNIHQDLHKYAEQSDEVKAYFARKKARKAELTGTEL